ncbi:hypothetical protein C1929_09925 [Stenotrophomonas sp. ZAC14D1_NAIMI4_6]|uniref:hypothetical protein n=1 Tax=unclassified Stenotrophomonas maltophilia group TaxID=2961925 RepID=UPI000D53FC19|nr:MULTISPECIES: hypothetical protein [unclassified Stenotrophomonas maltophilia group]AWH37042.1 hypothetical protein C1929_09925 [Stenotrophomonas sp. ZAC14D1_NAIMI4_6]AWH41233.1 hypothetical protein C1927_10260 [Stenotrophomonas sp. ZAC14D1_NAIMI4_1]
MIRLGPKMLLARARTRTQENVEETQLNGFARMYRDYQSWQALRFFGVVMIVAAMLMVGGWVIGLSAYFKIQGEGVLGKAEIHEIRTHQFGSGGTTSALRSCDAIYVPATKKRVIDFYTGDPGGAAAGLESDRAFCERVMQEVPRWREHQSRYPMGWGERIGWGLLTLAVSGSGLFFLVLIAHLMGARGRISLGVLAVWYVLSVFIFMLSAYDERRPSWASLDGTVTVRPIYFTDDGRVFTRPDSVYEWATDPPVQITGAGVLQMVNELMAGAAPGVSSNDGARPIPLGNVATDAGGVWERLETVAGAVDGGSSFAHELSVGMRRVDVTDPRLQANRIDVLLEVRDCGIPTKEDGSIIIARCFTTNGTPIGLVGGGSEARTLLQLQSIAPGASYYLVGQLSLGRRGGLFVALY